MKINCTITDTPRHQSSIISVIFIMLFLLLFHLPVFSADNGSSLIRNNWDDTSKFLAGIQLNSSSPLYQRTTSSQYGKHVLSMDRFWKLVKLETIDNMGTWQKKYLPMKPQDSTVFYPLSGADFINPFMLFPDSNTYIMAALEDPGVVPDISKMSEQGLKNILLSLQRSLYLYGKTNYFQTKIMIREMKNITRMGTTPAILIFMARLGLKINHVESIYINSSGDLTPFNIESGLKKKLNLTRGTRIRFTAPGDSRDRTLIYLKMRLGKETVDPLTPEGKFLGRINKANTIIKAGCYILHLKQFRELKDFIMSKSKIIVQDDSGIPYSSFNSDLWNIKLYGVYIPSYPISDTSVLKQKDLMDVYRKGSLPLSFNFGYGSLLGKNKSNLMVAEKKYKKED